MSEMNLEATLKSVFGFDRLRHGQQSVIDNVLSGHSAAAIFPTGSGKSLLSASSPVLTPLNFGRFPTDCVDERSIRLFSTAKAWPLRRLNRVKPKTEIQAVMNAVKQGQIKGVDDPG